VAADDGDGTHHHTGSLNLRALNAIGLLLVVCGPAAAQLDQGPKPVRGRAITTWQINGYSKDLITPREVLVRNDTTVPLSMTHGILSKCEHLPIECGAFVPDSIVVAPGGTITVLSVHPAKPGDKISFTSEVDGWRVATECIGAVGAAPGDVSDKRLLPVSRSMVIPPFPYPSSAKGVPLEITFFVGSNGLVDSTQIPALTDRGYLKEFKSAMARYTFRPGRRDGCPVPGTAHYTITLGN